MELSGTRGCGGYLSSIEIRNRYQREKQEPIGSELGSILAAEDAVKALLEKEADINSSNGSDTPLHVATFVADAELVELLLNTGRIPAKNTATKRLAVVRENERRVEGVYKFIGG